MKFYYLCEGEQVMKLKKVSSIIVTTLLLITSFGWTTFAANTTTQSTTKRYIIKFKTSGVDGKQIISKYNGNFKRQYKNIDAAVADITPQNAAKMQADSKVEYVEEDIVLKATDTLTNWGISDVQAPVSWQAGLTGAGVKIAVIDTGAAPHPDLAIAGGINVITGSTTTSYADDNGHGTHVAGIIAAQGVNGGVEGVAPGSSVYAVKALDSSGSGYVSDIVAGIDWAVGSNMNIISMSLGASKSSTLLMNAVDTAYNKGLLVVAAAGNSGNSKGAGTSIEYPANYPSVIAVGAVDSTNTRAYFSSTGSKLEVSAPGVNVISTYLNGGYAAMSGTSMATPFVAGDLALLKQKYPSYNNVQLRNILDGKFNIIDLGVTGRDSLYGYGLIQAPNGTVTVNLPSMPTASVSSGTYSSAQTIVLSDATPCVSIYYTLDGSTPTAKSTLYTGPITISSNKILRAAAIDSNGYSSNILTNQYTITKAKGNTKK